MPMLWLLLAAAAVAAGAAAPVQLVLEAQYELVNRSQAGAAGNKYGFEGGTVVVAAGAFHLVTSEVGAER